MKKSSRSTHSDTGSNTVRVANVTTANSLLEDAEEITKSEKQSSSFRERVSHLELQNVELRSILPRFLLLLAPALLAFLAGYFLKQDHADFFCWWGILYLYGWAAFPLVAHFFRGFVSAGYSFSKVLGILLTTGALWLISYLKIFESFSRPMTWVMFFLLAIVCWGIPKTRNAAFSALSDNSNMAHILLEEVIFIAVLTFLCFCRGLSPIINGEEKIMDFGFMNSMLRYDGLPAKDPWLAGQPINYYYYGQYIFSYLVKMTGIRSSVGYNLSMCTAIVFPFMSAYALGQLFIDALRRKMDCKVSIHYLPFAGLLSGLCTMFFGNSHSFFYDEQSIGNKVLFWKIWKGLGINVGNTGSFFYPNSTRFIGHNPDPYIDGLTDKADWTIHEFPFYSYLISDLHAHVVSLTIVLLIIAFMFIAVYHAKHPEKALNLMCRRHNFSKDLVSEMNFIFRPEFFLCAFFLGLTQMCNYWDFLIYFVFCAMGLLVYFGRRSTFLCTFSSFLIFVFDVGAILGIYLKFSNNVFLHICLQIAVFMIAYMLSTVFPSALSRTGTAMAMLFSLSCAIALSFNYNFDMISNSIKLVDRHTSLFQFMILWLIHILVPLSLIALVVFTERHAYKRTKLPALPAPLDLKRPDRAEASSKKHTSSRSSVRSSRITALEDDPDMSADEIGSIVTNDTSSDPDTGVIDEASDDSAFEEEEGSSTPRLLLMIISFFRLMDYHFARFGDMLLCKFFRKRSIIDIFMVGTSIVGFMMILAPEIIYVPDIYGDNNQRANTMFKFTFAGFVILSLVVAYTVFRFMAHVTKQGNLSNWGLAVSILLLVLIIMIPGHYTLRALDQRVGDIKMSRYIGLDGTAYLPNFIPVEKTFKDSSMRYQGAMVPYDEAIKWLNANEPDSVNICEAYGPSYSERCIVSAYTGLPDVVGWEVHEWLWHFHGWTDPETGEYKDDPETGSWARYLTPRHADVSAIYTDTNSIEVSRLLKKYDIKYVICGSMELDEFGYIYYPCLEELCERVYTSSDGSLFIYKVK